MRFALNMFPHTFVISLHILENNLINNFDYWFLFIKYAVFSNSYLYVKVYGHSYDNVSGEKGNVCFVCFHLIRCLSCFMRACIYVFVCVREYQEEKDQQWKQAMDYLSAVSELNYMTQIVIMLYEDNNKVGLLRALSLCRGTERR